MNEFTNVVGISIEPSTKIHFQVIELIDGLVGQILFGEKPVYQTPPRVIKKPEDYQNLMTDLRRHAEERLKAAFK